MNLFYYRKGFYTTIYLYDNANRLIKTTYPAVNGISVSTAQGYDWRGNVVTSTDRAGKTIKYSYDEANRLKSVSILITQSAANYQVTNYDYDALGRLASL